MNIAPLLLLAAFLAACSSKTPAESESPAPAAPAAPAVPTPPSAGDPGVDRTFDFVERTLRLIGSNRMAAVAFSEQVESGGNPITYIASNMPDEATFSPIAWGRPSKPRSVAVRDVPGGYAIEAYLDDLSTPVRTAIVPIPAARRE